MDDLLREFLTETSESLDTADNQLVRFEQEPSNARIVDNILAAMSASAPPIGVAAPKAAMMAGH